MTLDTYDVLRRQAAVAAMQALIRSNYAYCEVPSVTIARTAIKCANALVEEIKKLETQQEK